MTKFEQLHVGRSIDVITSLDVVAASRFVACANGLLSRFSGWRIGRSNGRPALLYVVGPDYREIVLWPWRS